MYAYMTFLLNLAAWMSCLMVAPPPPASSRVLNSSSSGAKPPCGVEEALTGAPFGAYDPMSNFG